MANHKLAAAKVTNRQPQAPSPRTAEIAPESGCSCDRRPASEPSRIAVGGGLSWGIIPAWCGPGRNAMANRETAIIEITPEVLLKAYACGIFPMAESAEDPALYWIEPEQRGVIPLDRFHVPARLARTVRADRFTVTVNRDFDAVIDGCAEPQPGRPRTWINERIRNLYRKLHERRHCHSVEVYRGRDAGRRPLRRDARPRLLRREHVPSRARRLQGRARASGRAAQGRRLPAARHPVRHRSPQDRSARSRCRGGSITSCWKRRSSAKPISPRSEPGTGVRRAGARAIDAGES